MTFRCASVVATMLLATAAVAHGQESGGPLVNRSSAPPALDYANARPAALPQAPKAPISQAQALRAPASQAAQPKIFSPGAAGDGTLMPVTLPTSTYVPEGPGGVSSQEYGTANQPYTTSLEANSQLDPYRRAGKLFFRDGSSTFVCSASLIRVGLVVTAAHCVSKFGQQRYYTDFQYIPAYSSGQAPYGVWDWAAVLAPRSYMFGKSKCAANAPGVVCDNDVAVIALKAKNGRYPGSFTGYFGFAIGGYSYTPNKQALVTQLGYPVSLNGGEQMIRTDSQGYVDATMAGNTVIGSLQTGGSSGGPWIVNFGAAPTASGNPFGTAADHNIVVGTTSWGYVNTGVKQQGASFFTNGNIAALVNAICPGYTSACF